MSKITGGNALLDVNNVLQTAQIGERMKVADLGCGSSGHFVFSTAALVGNRGRVYAIDILKTNLELVNRKVKQDNLENVETVWSDLEIFGATRIESGSLDIAMLINTLYLSHKRAEILREAIRMIKKGGQLLVVEWKNISSPFGPPSEERVKQELLKKAGQKLGLQIETEFDAGDYHYGVIFTKL